MSITLSESQIADLINATSSEPRSLLGYHEFAREQEIPVCVAYEIDGKRVDEVPVNQSDFHHAKPIYENFPGWDEDITGCKTFEELPKNAQDYVRALEKMSNCRISAIGVGPDRNATIVLHDMLG